MREHRLDQAAAAVEALEELFELSLPDFDTDARRDAIAAFTSVLLADRVHVRGRAVGASGWEDEWAVRSRRFIVGREYGSDIIVSDGKVSGAHVEIERFGSRVAVRDLDSTMGTTLNGRALVPFVLERVRPHAAIVLGGSYELSVLPPPRERVDYDGRAVVVLSPEQRTLARAIISLRNSGRPVGPRTLAAELAAQDGFSERSISRHVRALRDALEVPYTQHREHGYASIARIVGELGLLEP